MRLQKLSLCVQTRAGRSAGDVTKTGADVRLLKGYTEDGYFLLPFVVLTNQSCFTKCVQHPSCMSNRIMQTTQGVFQDKNCTGFPRGPRES